MTDHAMAFAGTSSNTGGCPTLFVTDRGTLVIQGTTVTDPVALETVRARGNGIPAHESAVEIPAALLPFVDIEALQRIAFADEDRPDFIVDPASAGKLQQLAEAVSR
ncbi:hypothetical protein AB0878_36650 [Amycolatopsis sp. NPDC047767]|uniref:hypothetical protein n=1 Tax=Amycolatopsis sp. NPDC047767 TaxID=3156765 RepID=UPI0034540AF7